MRVILFTVPTRFSHLSDRFNFQNVLCEAICNLSEEKISTLYVYQRKGMPQISLVDYISFDTRDSHWSGMTEKLNAAKLEREISYAYD